MRAIVGIAREVIDYGSSPLPIALRGQLEDRAVLRAAIERCAIEIA